MISYKTSQIQFAANKVLNLLYINPYNYDVDLELYKPPQLFLTLGRFKLKIWKSIMIHLIFAESNLAISIIIFLFIYGSSAEEAILILLIISICVMDIAIELFYLLEYDQNLQCMNGLILLNRRLEATFHKRRIQNDGIELIVCSIFCGPLLAFALAIPGTYLAYQQNWEFLRIFKYITNTLPAGNFLVAVTFASFTTICWCYGVLLFVQFLVHCNSICLWLKFQNDWAETHDTSKPTSEKKLQKSYRSHQILHLVVNQLVCYIIPVLIGTGCSLLITVLYCTFRLRKFWNYSIIAATLLLGLVILVAFYLLAKMIAQITYLSSKFKKSYQIGAVSCKPNVRFLRSCSTLKWKIGGSYEASSSMFLTIMNNIVINIFINLLVTFRDSGSDYFS